MRKKYYNKPSIEVLEVLTQGLMTWSPGGNGSVVVGGDNSGSKRSLANDDQMSYKNMYQGLDD